MPFFSIIIPIYNVEKYLKECLDSAIFQTFRDIEIICINDGSSDKSGEIAKEYAEKDSRILLIHQENQGLSMARNNAIARATGKYIVFLDSDDYIEKNLCEKLYEILQNYPVDVLLMDFNNFTPPNKIQKNSSNFLHHITQNTTLPIYSFFTQINKTKHIATTIAHFVCKNSILKKMPQPLFPINLFYEDLYFATHLLRTSNQVYCSDLSLYFYRQNPESIMHQKPTQEKFNKMLQSYLTLAKHFNTSLQDTEEKILKNYYQKVSKFCLKKALKTSFAYNHYLNLYLKDFFMLYSLFSMKQKLAFSYYIFWQKIKNLKNKRIS
ncbi:glycosyltransferase family 2 protein [Helicobacter anatolicus]|uniref:glycosyltransferase family 2 protein n=1 Tax=Helicobacter anatolicus TaxID=2905874 RepID=UPI001E34C7C8|nr:glycosyltransferase family 2 protein [Helicobacter anatolicus]MCE3039169.1 glycosyltransferase [Helicobacter anatolicus]